MLGEHPGPVEKRVVPGDVVGVHDRRPRYVGPEALDERALASSAAAIDRHDAWPTCGSSSSDIELLDQLAHRHNPPGTRCGLALLERHRPSHHALAPPFAPLPPTLPGLDRNGGASRSDPRTCAAAGSAARRRWPAPGTARTVPPAICRPDVR